MTGAARFNNKMNKVKGVSKTRTVLSNFDKRELYEKAIDEINTRLRKVDGIIPRMSTIAAVLKNTMPHYFWCGFYFAEEEEMVVGPYQGTSACPNIAYTGVCGTAARQKKSLIVANVHEFPGHIPCDDRSNSEIVVPMIDNGNHLIGVFDVDATEFNAFDNVDREYLERIMKILFEKNSMI